MNRCWANFGERLLGPCDKLTTNDIGLYDEHLALFRSEDGTGGKREVIPSSPDSNLSLYQRHDIMDLR